MENNNPTNAAVEVVKKAAVETAQKAVETKAAEINDSVDSKLEKMAEEAKADRQVMQKSIDEIAAQRKSFFGIGGAKLNQKQEQLKDIAENIKTKGRFATDLSQKTFVNPGAFSAIPGVGAPTGGGGVGASMLNQASTIYHQPNFKTQLRDVINTRTSDGGAIIWNRETDETDSAGPKGRGLNATQTSKTITRQEATFKTLTNFYTMPEEYLDDIAAFESYISTRLMKDLLDSESRNIIRGPGAGNNLISTVAGNSYNGINTFGTNLIGSSLAATRTALGSWSQSIGDFSDGIFANRYDAIIALASILQQADYSPDCVVLNPFDYNQLTLTKSNDGYDFKYGVDPATGQFKTWLSSGSEVIVTNAQLAGTVTVFDKSSFEYVMREGIAVEFDRNGSDFQANNISIRAQLRGELADWLPQGVVHGTFGTTAANTQNGLLNAITAA